MLHRILCLSLSCLLPASLALAQSPSASRLDDVIKSGKLRVCTPGDYKPFSFYKPDGSYEGLAASGAKTTGKVAVAGGKGSYRSTSSEGTVTLSTEGGKDVLTFMRADLKGSARLERVK